MQGALMKNLTSPVIEIDGVEVPTFIYGTAWKEDKTTTLVTSALNAGFRAIDTANQRKHYFEQGVGDALRSAFENGEFKRDQLFLQTKFTYVNGQDHRLPYDPNADFATQVKQSCDSSLEHLPTNYLDSYILHGPQSFPGLMQADSDVWRAMESLHAEGKVKLLGVSNMNLNQLQEMVAHAKVPVRFIQNRCYAETGWDKEIRDFCQKNDITYQGFSLLTANRGVVAHERIGSIASRYGKTPQQVIFRFAQQVGMIPLTGTSSAENMTCDLGIYDFKLDPGEIELIERIAV